MQLDIRSLARAGAQVRLTELAAEMTAIRRAFPGLGTAPGRQASVAVDGNGDGHRRGRRRMSAAEKKAVSVRMKKYLGGATEGRRDA